MIGLCFAVLRYPINRHHPTPLRPTHSPLFTVTCHLSQLIVHGNHHILAPLSFIHLSICPTVSYLCCHWHIIKLNVVIIEVPFKSFQTPTPPLYSFAAPRLALLRQPPRLCVFIAYLLICLRCLFSLLSSPSNKIKTYSRHDYVGSLASCCYYRIPCLWFSSRRVALSCLLLFVT